MSAPALQPSEAPAPALPRWAAWALTREPGDAQAIFRIAMGLCVWVSLGSVLWHGDLAPLWHDARHGGFSGLGGGWLFDLLGGTDPGRVHLVIGATLASAALLTVGLGNRVPALLSLWGYSAVVHLQGDAGGSYDTLLNNGLWLAALSGGTSTLSLDCWLRTKRFRSDRAVLAFPRWLTLYQLVLVYFTTGLQKLSDTWVPGGSLSAVYFVMQQPTWQRIPMRWLAPLYPLTQVATLLVWCFEVGAPLLLLAIWLERRGRGRVGRWLSRVPFRRAWAAFGLTLHIGIGLSLVLGVFPMLAMAFYVALWDPARKEKGAPVAGRALEASASDPQAAAAATPPAFGSSP